MPTPTPAPSSTAGTIPEARTHAIGSRVSIEGIVSAEGGRIGTPSLIAVADATGAIIVRVPEGATFPVRSRRISATGQLADPYGQLEIRPSLDGFRILGSGSSVSPQTIAGKDPNEPREARLVRLDGVMITTARKATSGDLSFDLRATDGTAVRVMADASSGLTASTFAKGTTYRLTGIVGQRASHKGALDGYRLWLRDRADVHVLAAAPNPGSSPGAGSGPGSTATTMTVRAALLTHDRQVRIRATVTAGPKLLDSSGKRIIVQDATAAIEVYLPSSAGAPRVGRLVSVDGTVVRAYGAPRLKAAGLKDVGGGSLPRPLELRAVPTAALEWRLVRTTGTVAEVHKLGDRWRADLSVSGVRIPISGLSGSGTQASALVEGRTATIVGIARRPYPTATDRRFAIVPRNGRDVTLGPVASGTTSGSAPGGTSNGSTQTAGTSGAGPIDADVAALEQHVGATVRVGGLVIELLGDGVTLDDGTGVGRIVLLDEAAEYLPLLEPGDAINAVGLVELRDGQLMVVVREAAGISRVGDLIGDSGTTSALDPAAVGSESPVQPALATATDPLGLPVPGVAGLASLALVTLASVVVTLVRRRRIRRQFLARVSARLATVATPTAQTPPQRPPMTSTGIDDRL
jgi:hypothetical protein